MEIQLQELIEQIKKDGITVAESEAASIIDAANIEAEKIISVAKSEAEKLLIEANLQNERMLRVSEDAIRQAGRNVLISFRESVAKELDAVIGDKVSLAYSSDSISALIIKVVEVWSNNPEVEDISVLLNEKDLLQLESDLLATLKSKMIKGVTLKANDNFDGGFRIAVNNGHAYYDYSKDAVIEMMSSYMNPKVTALMKEALEV